MLKEIVKIELKGEHLCIIGDFNRHIGDAVGGNHKSTISTGGKLIRELLDTRRYILVNATEKVEGGPYTRYDPACPDDDLKKSVLDLCIVSADLLRYLDKMVIDKDRVRTPFRPVAGDKRVYSDHYTLTIEFSGIPLKNRQCYLRRKTTAWNTNKEGGWDTFRNLTMHNENLINVAQEENEPNRLLGKIEKEVTSVKYKAFGKVKVQNNKSINREVEGLLKERNRLTKFKSCDKENNERY